jgi:hypothetical protein
MSRKSIRLENMMKANKTLLGEQEIIKEEKKECTCDKCDCNGECKDSCDCNCCK